MDVPWLRFEVAEQGYAPGGGRVGRAPPHRFRGSRLELAGIVNGERLPSTAVRCTTDTAR